MCTRPPLVAPHTSPSLRLRTFPFPVRPIRANVDGRRLPAAATTRRNRVHDPARNRLDRHPRRPPRDGTAHAHIRPSRADLGGPHRRLPPGLPGPAVPVPQHRPRPDRPSRRLLRPRRAGRHVDHLPDPASINSPGVPPGRPPAPSTGRPRPSTAWAPSPSTGAGSIPVPGVPRPAARESPPPGLLRAPRIPRRPRPPARPVAGHSRPRLLFRLAQAGDPRPHLGGDRRSRRRYPALARALEDVGGTHPPHLAPHRRGPGATAGTPRPRQPGATAFPFAAGARRGAPPVRRPRYRPASSTIAGALPRAT